MITTENDRKLPSSGVGRYDTSYGLAYPGYESRVLHLADWWVVLIRDLLELVVSVKLNLVSQVPELLFEAGFNQVDRTMVNSEFSLETAGGVSLVAQKLPMKAYLAASRQHGETQLARSSIN